MLQYEFYSIRRGNTCVVEITPEQYEKYAKDYSELTAKQKKAWGVPTVDDWIELILAYNV